MTRTALSPSYVDVNNAVIGGGPFSGPAADGDTIVIPPGSATWPHQVTVAAALTIQGAGGIGAKGLGTALTTINAAMTLNGDNACFRLQTVAGKPYRLTGIEFRGTGRPKGTQSGLVACAGKSHLIRVDHCRFTLANDQRSMFVSDWAMGVCDNCYFSGTEQKVEVGHSAWNNGTNGDGSWSAPHTFGMAGASLDGGAFYFEDCTADNGTANDKIGFIDCEFGGRYCVRYSDFDDSTINNHGTQGNQQDRGCRQIEVYNNTFSNMHSHPVDSRAGSAVVWGNAVIDSPQIGGNIALKVNDYRAVNLPGGRWDGANGKATQDKNYPGGPFFTGTHTGLAGATKLTDANSNGGSHWTPNQLVGYSVYSPSQNRHSIIISNTPTEITYGAPTVGASIIAWGSSEAYEIWHVQHALDMPGMGQDAGLNRSVSPYQWPNQTIEGCYVWNNTVNGSPAGVLNSFYPHIKLNTHFFLTARPGYVPYTYPHPLRGTDSPTITSADSVSFTEGVGGTFQVRSSGFTAGPTFSRSGGTFPATGTTFNSSGLLTVGASSAAGTYTFTINAVNGSESSDPQSFTLLITAAPTRVIAITGSLAFGDLDVNLTTTRSFTIANNGNSTLTVTNITLPSGFTADWTSGTILAGASHVVTVTFAPTAASTYSGTVTVVSDKTSGANTLAASGTGTARVIGLSGSLAFGNVTVGQTATRPLTISNSGNRTLTISAINYPQDFSGDLTATTIPAGGNKILNVTFSPSAVQGYSGTIDITSNKTSGTSSASESGTGTAAATKIIQIAGGPLDFGNVQVGTTQSRALTLSNSGTATLNVSGITLPSGYSADWTSGTIAAGASQVVNVTFAPSAVQTYSGTITVTSDATGGANTTTVTGAGVSAATRIIGLTGDLAFGNVSIGTSSTRQLTITNSGSADLAVSSITLPSGFSGSFSGTIAPGASQTVDVTFSPTLSQAYGGTVTVTSNSTSGTNTMPVSGTGVAPATRVIGLVGNLVFGNVQKRHSVQRPLTIKNTGTAPLVVTGITCPTAFSVNWTSGTIPAGGSQAVIVTFSPLNAQHYGGNIVVASNKTSGANTIACSGTGTNRKQVPFFLIVA